MHLLKAVVAFVGADHAAAFADAGDDADGFGVRAQERARELGEPAGLIRDVPEEVLGVVVERRAGFIQLFERMIDQPKGCCRIIEQLFRRSHEHFL